MLNRKRIEELKIRYSKHESVQECCRKLGLTMKQCDSYDLCDICYDENTEAHIEAIADTGEFACGDLDCKELYKKVTGKEYSRKEENCIECQDCAKEYIGEDFKKVFNNLNKRGDGNV